MKENFSEDENYEIDKNESKENRTKSKIKEYFKNNNFLIKKNFNNFLIFIGLGQIWSTESEQKLFWDKIVSYTANKNNVDSVDYEAVLCGISDFFEEEEDEINEENDKSNDNDSSLDYDLQSLHLKSKFEGDENIRNSNNENCIDEFLNNLKDKQGIIYGIRFINELYFNKYLEIDKLDTPFKINKNIIINEIQMKYKFINIPHDILRNYFNCIKSDDINKKDAFFIDKSVIKYINVILNDKNEENNYKYSIKSFYSNNSMTFDNNDNISSNIEQLSLIDSYVTDCIGAMINFSDNKNFLELAKKYIKNYINNIKNSIYDEIKMKEKKYEEKILIMNNDNNNNENIVIENNKLKKQIELLMKENLSLAKELEDLYSQRDKLENENDQKQITRKSLTPRYNYIDGQNNLSNKKNKIFIPPLKLKEPYSDRKDIISTEQTNEFGRIDTIKSDNSNSISSKSKSKLHILKGSGTSSYNDICIDELTNSQFNFSSNLNNITDQFLLDTTRLCNEEGEDREEEKSNKIKRNEKDRYSRINSQKKIIKKKDNILYNYLNSDISRIKDENDEFDDYNDEDINFGLNFNNKYATRFSDNNIRYSDAHINKKTNKNYNKALSINGSNSNNYIILKKKVKTTNEDIFYGYVNKTVKEFYDFKYLNHIHKIEKLLSHYNEELISNEFFSDEINAYFLNSKKKRFILLLTYNAFYFLKSDDSLESALRKSNDSLESIIASTKNFNLLLLSFNGGTDIIIETYQRIELLKFFQKIIDKGKFSQNLNISSSNHFFFHKRNGTLENVPTIRNKTFLITPNFENAQKIGILLKYKESFFSAAFHEKLVVLSSVGLMYFDENNKTPKAIIPIIGTTIKFIVVQVNKVIFCLKMKTINDEVYIFGSLKKKEIFDWMKKLADFKKVYHMKMKDINPKFVAQNSKELSNNVNLSKN